MLNPDTPRGRYPKRVIDAVSEVERGFWEHADDPEYYATHMHERGLMVLPGVGVLDRAATMAAVANATPWDRFELSDERIAVFDDSTVVLAYAADASRGPTRYRALIASVYIADSAGGWKLVLHQQTPVAE